MKRNNIKPIYKIIICIIVSLVIDFLYLYAEFKYFIELICFDTFFGLFPIESEFIANMLYAAIGLVAGLVVVLTCKVLRLGGKGKKIFIIVHSIVIVGFLVFLYSTLYGFNIFIQ